MKHKIQKVELFVGVIVLLGGLLTYGLGVHQLLPVPRPDLVVYGTTLIGIILILMGCDIFSKPTKEMQMILDAYNPSQIPMSLSLHHA